MPDINDDLSLLENIEADSQLESHPAQNLPFQHVPEDAVRNLDTMLVEFSEVGDTAGTAMRTANEALTIEKEGKIDELKAQELAQDTPEILGTPETPLVYTQVPTAVGAKRAVSILEKSSANTMEAAKKKAILIIGNAIRMATDELTTNEAAWITTLAGYGLAQANVTESLGSLPQDSYKIFIGNDPAPEAMTVEIYPKDAGTDHGTVINELIKSISPLLTNLTGGPGELFFETEPVIYNGTVKYHLDTLVKGEFYPITVDQTFNQIRSVTAWVTLPSDRLPVVVDKLRAAAASMIQLLRTKGEAMETRTDMSVQEATDIISDVVRIASILAKVVKYLEAAQLVTLAASQFYNSLAVNDNPTTVLVNPSNERFIQRPKSRLF